MRISVNLASKPFADIGPAIWRLRIAMLAMAVVCIALGIGLYFIHNAAAASRVRERSLDTSIARLDHERQNYQDIMHEPQNSQVLDQTHALNQLIDAKAFSWTLAAEDLERVLPGGVQVTTLEPTVDKKDGHITVRLRVVGPRDKAVELVQNLEHSRRFLQPRIIGESAEGSSAPGAAMQPVSATNRVNFELLADYNTTTPEESKTAQKSSATGEDETATPGAEGTNATSSSRGPGLRRPPSTGVSHPPHRKTARKPNPKPNPGAPR